MRVPVRFPAGHDDLIHDIAYDYYGKRLATCSSDRKVKVWDKDEKGQWICTAEWTAHSGSVLKLAWAHPEFGQILASCSFDRTVAIWEERGAPESAPKAPTWVQRASLVDHKATVRDIAFAPRHLGLKLATCSEDGMVRVYEAIDVMNLGHWPLIDEFTTGKGGSSALSWNTSRFDPPTLVESNKENTIKIWEYNDHHRTWQSTDMLVGHTDTIHDVAWAPQMGRSYHLIASCGKDKTVRIWKIVISSDRSVVSSEQVACFDDHASEVWRVSWNVTGTVLASTGDDGTLRLWKANPMNVWQCVSTLEAGELKS